MLAVPGAGQGVCSRSVSPTLVDIPATNLEQRQQAILRHQHDAQIRSDQKAETPSQ
jgi:hypothetical protein